MKVFAPFRPQANAQVFPPLFTFFSAQADFWQNTRFFSLQWAAVLEEDRAMLWNAGKSHPDDREGGSGASTGKLTPFAAIAAPCSRQYF